MHVKREIIQLRLIPRHPSFLQGVGSDLVDIIDWLQNVKGQPKEKWIWQIPPNETGMQEHLALNVGENACTFCSRSRTDAVYEVDERLLQRDAEERYGPVTDMEVKRLENQLAGMARLLREVQQHGPEHWTERQRAMFQW